jgi:uncharacterized RDD family membrane protein YckC
MTTIRGDSLPAYASFSARVMAVLTDSVVIGSGLALIVLIGSVLDRVPGSGRVEAAAVWSLLILYEPLLVWRRGATVGHRRYGLRVVTADGARPGLPRAVVRYLVKAVLGLLSFVSMFFTRRHQALQDLLTQTQVVVVDPAGAPSYLMVREREPAWLGDPAPLWRRLVMIVIYLIVLGVLVAIGFALLPDDCVERQRCTAGQRILLDLAALVWLAGSVAIVLAGWRSWLPGARYRRHGVDPVTVI